MCIQSLEFLFIFFILTLWLDSKSQTRIESYTSFFSTSQMSEAGRHMAKICVVLSCGLAGYPLNLVWSHCSGPFQANMQCPKETPPPFLCYMPIRPLSKTALVDPLTFGLLDFLASSCISRPVLALHIILILPGWWVSVSLPRSSVPSCHPQVSRNISELIFKVGLTFHSYELNLHLGYRLWSSRALLFNESMEHGHFHRTTWSCLPVT